MGGGTHDQALTSLQEASADGTWLCFQNLHLVVAWLPTLEKALAALSRDRREPTDAVGQNTAVHLEIRERDPAAGWSGGLRFIRGGVPKALGARGVPLNDLEGREFLGGEGGWAPPLQLLSGGGP